MKRQGKKITLIGLIGVALIVAGIGLSLFQNHENDTEFNDAVRFSKEYTQVSKDNVFVFKSADEIVDILEHGTGIVFLGFSECSWCQAYAPILNDVAKEVGIEKIYYLDIRKDRSDNTTEYQAIIEILRDHLDLDNEGNPRVFVPDVSVVNNGAIVGHDNETSTISGEITPKEYWTDEKITALKNRLRVMMREIAIS